MLLLALLFIPLLLVPEFVRITAEVAEGFLFAEWFIWSAFALELGIKTFLAPNRKQYLIRHWYDVVIVAIPFLRPLRVVRSLRVLRMGRALRLVSVGTRLINEARLIVTSHGLHYAVLVASIVFFALAGLALAFERQAADANIHSLDDALWWSVTTATTVGYGDRFPVTTEGRAVAVLLMFLGVSLFSVMTATIAASFARPAAAKQEATLEDVLQRLEEMEARLLAVQRGQDVILEDVRQVEETVRSDN
jgi:voltage-gated potassium channel